jgi:hypothetical protein
MLLAACVPATLGRAQDRLAPPHEAVTEPAADRPIAAVKENATTDLSLAMEYFTGEWRTVKERAGAALIVRGAPVRVSGLAGTVFVEVCRADAPADPFRVYVLQGYQRRGEMRLRQFDFIGGAELPRALGGLALAPRALASIDPAALTPVIDMPLMRKGLGFEASTEHPFPTMRGGATEMTSSLTLGIDSIVVREAGFDADGKQVWGDESGGVIEVVPSSPQPKAIEPLPSGLTIITTVAPLPDAPRHTEGGELSIAFTSWTAAGVKIQSTRDPGREPIKVRVPGAPLAALDTALAGMPKGERRKVVIPPTLAYGDRGRGVVPPNSTLIYDIECIDVNNTPGPPARPPAPTADPHVHPTAPVPPPPRPAPGDGPIGNPPTNPDPETPR